MSKKPFEPNKNGLVVVKLVKSYGTNVAGETCGFIPEIAKELVKKGYAVLPGQDVPAEKPADGGDGAEITTRKFNPAKQEVDQVVPGSATDSLRKEFKELTGKDADSRWGAARLAAEIEKAIEAATAPADAAKPEAARGDE